MEWPPLKSGVSGRVLLNDGVIGNSAFDDSVLGSGVWSVRQCARGQCGRQHISGSTVMCTAAAYLMTAYVSDVGVF